MSEKEVTGCLPGEGEPLAGAMRRERERGMAMLERKKVEYGMPVKEKNALWKAQAALNFGNDGVELLIATFLSIRLADFEEWLSQQGVDPLQYRWHFQWIEERATRLDKLAMLLAKLGDAGEIIHQGLLTSAWLQVPPNQTSQADLVSADGQSPPPEQGGCR